MATSQDGFKPLLQPPPGVTPHLFVPGKSEKTIVVLVAVCVPIATAFVWARMYTRICLIKSHGWEDCESFDFQRRTEIRC